MFYSIGQSLNYLPFIFGLLSFNVATPPYPTPPQPSPARPAQPTPSWPFLSPQNFCFLQTNDLVSMLKFFRSQHE
jgi:hypothetical protein